MLALALAMAACGDEDSGNPIADTNPDVGGDQTVDVGDDSEPGDGGDDSEPGDGGGDLSDVADADADADAFGDAVDVVDEVEDGDEPPTDGGDDAGDVPADTDVPVEMDMGFDFDPDYSLDPMIVDCPGDPVPPGPNRCNVSAGADPNWVLLRGTVLGYRRLFNNGQVLYNSANGTIRCAGCGCDTIGTAADATVVACAGGVISPGLINAHDHIDFSVMAPIAHTDRYEHRHDWRRGERGHDFPFFNRNPNDDGVIWGELRQLMGGATSIVGPFAGDGLLRNLDYADSLEGLDEDNIEFETFPLDDFDPIYNSLTCQYGSGRDEQSDMASDPAYLPHIAEGVDEFAHNEISCTDPPGGGSQDIVLANTAVIHGVATHPGDIAAIAQSGAQLIWSPRSNISLYGNTAMVTVYDRLGVPVTLGTDWSISGGMNVVRELACADEWNALRLDNYFTDEQLFRMVTENAAIATDSETSLGLLRRGHVADISIFDGSLNSDYRAIIDAEPEDVVLVLRGGLPLFGDAALLQSLTDVSECETLDVCGNSTRVCLEREAGWNVNALRTRVGGDRYPLFFCGGPPPDEPTCVPSRVGEYDGTIDIDDADGDGIDNAQDNCASVFNPPRLMDPGFTQGDFDSDGVGDPCDPCPLEPDATVCDVIVLTDRDGDGVDDVVDACPVHFNPGQTDTDEDDVPDACDSCPNFPNAGNEPCEVTIYEVQQSLIPRGQEVIVQGVVTAVRGPIFYIQVPEVDWDEDLLAEYSGVVVYIPSSNPEGLTIPTRGELVTLAAEVSSFDGRVELSFVESITVDGTAALPAPVEVETDEVTTGGALARPLEGVLVRVEGDVTAGFNEFGEYTLDGILLVDDFIYTTEPTPLVDDILGVTGALRFANGDTKVVPRDQADIDFIQTAPPQLQSVEPAFAYVEPEESFGPTYPPVIMTLDRPAPVDGTVVSLQSDSAQLTVGESVTILEGERTAALSVRGEQVTVSDVTVTVSLDDDSFPVAIQVLPTARDPMVTSFEPDPATAVVDVPLTIRIHLDQPVPETGLAIQLSATAESGADIDGVLDFPDSVETLHWDFYADVVVTGLVADTVTLTATVPNHDDESVVIEILEIPPLGLIVSEVFYDVDNGEMGDGTFEWVEIYNGDSVPIDVDGYILASGGSNWSNSLDLDLAAPIPVGGCVVVGGPMSAAINYNPSFAQAEDLSPDIQNGGTAGDGVALFLPGANLSSDFPIDAVIYGRNNDNNLRKHEDAPAGHDVDDVSAGNSIERAAGAGLGETIWRTQSSPNPNDCTAILE